MTRNLVSGQWLGVLLVLVPLVHGSRCRGVDRLCVHSAGPDCDGGARPAGVRRGAWDGLPVSSRRPEAAVPVAAVLLLEMVMKVFTLMILLSVTGCASGPVKFAEPDKNAPVWDLNVARTQGTNDLIHESTFTMGGGR